jgi:hypothetical protein
MISIFAVELTIFDSFTLHIVSSTENKSKFVTLPTFEHHAKVKQVARSIDAKAK